MWLLVWVTFTTTHNLPISHTFDVFTDYYQCEEVRRYVLNSKSIDPSREVVACLEIKPDE